MRGSCGTGFGSCGTGFRISGVSTSLAGKQLAQRGWLLARDLERWDPPEPGLGYPVYPPIAYSIGGCPIDDNLQRPFLFL